MAATEALAQANRDPTRTTTLRKRYAQRLRGGFGRINAVIRPAVQSEDVLALRGESLAEPPPDFSDDRPVRRAESFQDWLQDQLQDEVLQTVGPNGNQFVRTAYSKGLEHAAWALRNEDFTADVPSVEVAFRLPIHRNTLELLYTQDYQQLKGITDATAQQAARVITDGFKSGISPTQMARDITGRIDAIGKTRATVLARTSVVAAHNEAALNRYERAGIEDVSAQVEFTTAGDRRVCPQCRSLEGDTYSIDEARGVIPVHPQCRCAWLPVVS